MFQWTTSLFGIMKFLKLVKGSLDSHHDTTCTITWDSMMIFEETTKSLFTSDLFIQPETINQQYPMTYQKI